MLRFFMAFVRILLLFAAFLPVESQTIGVQGVGHNDEKQRASVEVSPPSLRERSISITRLRVPRKARELYKRARRAFQKHRDATAQEKLDQALQRCPAFPEALTLRGFIQLDLNQWGFAEDNLQAAVRIDPTYELAYRLLGELYNRERRFDDALDASQRAAALNPNSWLVAYELARAFIGKQQYALALNISDAALAHNRGTLLHVAKAHALLGLGRYPEAVTELRAYLDYQPAGDGSQDAHDLLDQIQSATGQ